MTISHKFVFLMRFFQKNLLTELNMYVNTLPDMQRLLSQSGEKIELAPR